MASRPIHLMIVGTHPADVVDQAGGTLAHHIEQGDKVTAVIVTTGARSHHWKLIDQKRRQQEELDVEPLIAQVAQEKLEESRRACAILGITDVRGLGFSDDDILVNLDLIEAIADVIRDVRPDVLILHHPYEMGGLKMHATVGQSTIYAWQQAAGAGRGNKRTHSVPSLYIMNPVAYRGHNTLEYASTEHPNLYVDITDVIEKKVKAYDEISTQYYDGAYARKAVETGDGAYGNKGYVAYAEVFQCFFPWVRYTLPVTDAELRRSEEMGPAGMIRRSEIVAALMPLPQGHSYSSEFRMTKEMYED